MADDVYVTCTVSPCVIVHKIDLPPFQLDTAEGALIAAAVVAVWAVGWAFRMFIRTLSIDRNPTSESD